MEETNEVVKRIECVGMDWIKLD